MFNALMDMDINANTNTVELNKQDKYNKHQSRIQLHRKKQAYDFNLLNEQKYINIPLLPACKLREGVVSRSFLADDL